MLEIAIFFQGFPRANGYFFQTGFANIFRNMHFFFSAIQCIVSKKQSVGSVHEVLTESLEIAFDEDQFTVNLHNFLQPLVLPRHIVSQSESFVSHPPRQNNFQNSSPLDISETALVCIFSSILNLARQTKRIH